MNVICMLDYRVSWRPVKAVCFHCGATWTAVVPETITAASRMECPRCELGAGTIAKEPPAGWSNMSEEQLAEHGWGEDSP